MPNGKSNATPVPSNPYSPDDEKAVCMADVDRLSERIIASGPAARVKARYGLTDEEAEIAVERQKVYGDPWINHLGIAQSWAGMLQPWAARIARMEPLPPHVVALLLASLKLNRMRMIYHADNYVDSSVYEKFANAWQAEHFRDGGEYPIVIPPKPFPGAVLKIEWVEPEDKKVDFSFDPG